MIILIRLVVNKNMSSFKQVEFKFVITRKEEDTMMTVGSKEYLTELRQWWLRFEHGETESEIRKEGKTTRVAKLYALFLLNRICPQIKEMLFVNREFLFGPLDVTKLRLAAKCLYPPSADVIRARLLTGHYTSRGC